MTPDEEEAVRRLLAEAGDETPVMPPDVAARLDDVLAGLVADRSAPEDTPDEVTRVTDRSTRRSHLWPKLLVAAAAVSVVGLGVGNVLDEVGSGSGEPSTAERAVGGSAADRAHAGEAEAAPSPSERGSTDSQAPQAGVTPAKKLPRLRTGSLTVDAQRIADFPLENALTSGHLDRREAQTGTECARPATRNGDEVLLVRLDGVRSVLVLRAPKGGERSAEVFRCSDPASPVAETTVEDR